MESRLLFSSAFQSPAVVETSLSSFSKLIAGDFNGDGRADVIAAGYLNSDPAQFLAGNGDGTFAAPVSLGFHGGSEILTGDFNGDGKPDLAVGNSTGHAVNIELGRGDGTFALANTLTPGGTVIPLGADDFDHDGKTDLLLEIEPNGVDSSLDEIVVYKGIGNGTFNSGAPITTSPIAGNGVAIGDFNGDGNLDVVVADQLLYSVSLLSGDGHGGLQAQATYSTPVGSILSSADLNGDHITDLLLANNAGVNVMLGSAGRLGALVAVSNVTASGPAVAADMNSDGIVDVLTASVEQQVCLLTGNGDGTFASPRQTIVPDRPTAPVVADFNSDGKPDVLLGDNFAANRLVLLKSGPLASLAPSQITLASPQNPAIENTGTTITATLTGAGGIPGGNVVLFVDGRAMQTSPLDSSGTASFPFGYLIGSYSITAAYTGDARFAASQSEPLTQKIISGSPFSVRLLSYHLPRVLAPGHPANLRISVRNTGSQAATLTNITVMASEDQTIYGAGHNPRMDLLSLNKTVSLAAGMTRVFRLVIHKSESEPLQGPHYLVVNVQDAADRPQWASTPQVDMETSLVDYTGTFADAAPLAVKSGSVATITLRLSNLSGNSSAASPVGIYLTVATSPSGKPVHLANITRHIGLRPGTSRLLRIRVRVPSNLAAGTYLLTASLNVRDDAIQLFDVDTSNNQVQGTLAVS